MDASSSSFDAATATVEAAAVAATAAVAVMVRTARWIVDSDRRKNHDDEIIFLHDNNIKFNTLN